MENSPHWLFWLFGQWRVCPGWESQIEYSSSLCCYHQHCPSPVQQTARNWHSSCRKGTWPRLPLLQQLLQPPLPLLLLSCFLCWLLLLLPPEKLFCCVTLNLKFNLSNKNSVMNIFVNGTVNLLQTSGQTFIIELRMEPVDLKYLTFDWPNCV